MRQLVIALVLGGLVSMAGPAGAQDWMPVATLELSQGFVAAGIGFSWGSGTLMMKRVEDVFTGSSKPRSFGAGREIEPPWACPHPRWRQVA
jgi:hypothetical protein